MLAFGVNHYVPILLAKRGELNALKDLTHHSHGRFTPLLMLPTVVTGKALDEHIGKFSETLKKSWDGTDTIFVDVPYLSNSNQLVNGQHPVSSLFSLCRNLGINAVPVTAPDRGQAYNTAVKDVVKAGGQGVCIRVPKSELPRGVPAVMMMLKQLKFTPPAVDLILDLGTVAIQDVAMLTTALVSILSAPPFDQPWRTVTLASGAFPEHLGGLAKGRNELPRADWVLWESVRDQLPKEVRCPTFGDYGVLSPVWRELNQAVIRVSANIRYTTRKYWLVAKGGIIRGRGSVGSGEYRKLCQGLVNTNEYRGEHFSPGDQHIRRCADGQTGPGNPEMWLRQGTSHHIATVVDQFANLSSP